MAHKLWFTSYKTYQNYTGVLYKYTKKHIKHIILQLLIGFVKIYWKNEIGWTHKRKLRITRNDENHYTWEYNNMEPARIVANKETYHNIYDIKRGEMYININT